MSNSSVESLNHSLDGSGSESDTNSINTINTSVDGNIGDVEEQTFLTLGDTTLIETAPLPMLERKQAELNLEDCYKNGGSSRFWEDNNCPQNDDSSTRNEITPSCTVGPNGYERFQTDDGQWLEVRGWGDGSVGSFVREDEGKFGSVKGTAQKEGRDGDGSSRDSGC
ncbi:hypothetical protein M231_01233 [Tremella mesenterica]|uniref:Uncharacterized protein n=1 Tax=Tremella mesenterica TaxID=5217 RepID=A0A4Q1BU01_TREME|nr:uncharacterized protein TREMEDRAFT_64137 [Tremella mesenterica DSM 1558]EIW67548.1 hypothetical protein TREMEDRAFT_64137 [Tremella mesenterica DSM 1558]RXK41525.1 hypothetical protein M231_01233 [Tremella mesenterica]